MLSRVAIGARAAVATEHPLASLAAYEAMKGGGNAVDAAVAASYALAVTFYPANGVGGDFFALLYEAKTGRVRCLNASGWAPTGLTLGLVKSTGEKGVPLFGPLSVVVPGYVAGVSELHSRFGRSEFGDLVAPALGYAKHGFPALSGVCSSTAANMPFLSKSARKVYAPGGRPPEPGDTIKQPQLAAVIEAIRDGGPSAFYDGWPAERIRETLQGLGVPAEDGDFREFRPEWVTPLDADYRGVTVSEVPPNSMGATSLLMLNELARRDLKNAGPLSLDRMKLTMKAAEEAYSRKDAMLGDPRFSEIDVKKFLEPSAPAGRRRANPVRGGDTTAFSVADGEGNLVSGIQSLYHHFGSHVFVEACGFMLSNRGAGFSTKGPNRLEPRKRPLHTLSAMFLAKGGRPYASIGCSGGEYRPMQHALFVTNMVDYGMSLEEAVEHPRFLWSGGRTLAVEEGYRSEGLDYDVRRLPFPGRTGVCQGVEELGSAKKAVCDVRGDGLPVAG